MEEIVPSIFLLRTQCWDIGILPYFEHQNVLVTQDGKGGDTWLPVIRCLWDSVPQTSIYSNSNSAVVKPPGGGCNILPRSQVPILGLYYATISTIATSSGSGTCGAAQNANRWRQQRPLFHFLFRSRGLGKAGNTISFSGARGLGKREIPFPFPVHVAQGTGKYHFRFRCTWNLGGWRKPGYRDSSQGLSLSRDLAGVYTSAAVFQTQQTVTHLECVEPRGGNAYPSRHWDLYLCLRPILRSALGSI